MKSLDKDGNGSIDFEEFYSWWTSKPASSVAVDSADPKLAMLKTKLRSQTFMRAITNVFQRLSHKRVEDDKNLPVDLLLKGTPVFFFNFERSSLNCIGVQLATFHLDKRMDLSFVSTKLKKLVRIPPSSLNLLASLTI